MSVAKARKGDRHDGPNGPSTVRAPCTSAFEHGGGWWCITHHERYALDSKSGHTADERHHLVAWWCPDHNALEVS